MDAVLGLPQYGRVLLIGATDTGKTTLVSSLARALSRSGKLPVAIVDGDIGQSEIGSPGVVGLGLLDGRETNSGGSDGEEREPRGFSRLSMLTGVFVGAVTPQGHATDTVSAVIQVTQSALLLNPRPYCTLIDTPGFTTGSGATLLRALIDVIRPQLVIALCRDNELEPILRPFSKRAGASNDTGQGRTRIHYEPISPQVGRKTPAVRATRRAARFAQHLSGAREMMLEWETGMAGSSVVLEKTWISYGQPLPPHELQFVSRTLGAPCLHAERHYDGSLTAVVNGSLPLFRQPPKGSGPIATLEQSLRVRRVTLETAERYTGLLCGLISARGDLIGIGRLTAIDFLRRSVTMATPVKTPGAVARLAFGAVRLKPDGRELPPLPDEMRR